MTTVAPSQVPWGTKAFSHYLGEDRSAWAGHDASVLTATTAWRRPILVDQGLADDFLESQLRPELFEAACAAAGIVVGVASLTGVIVMLTVAVSVWPSLSVMVYVKESVKFSVPSCVYV